MMPESNEQETARSKYEDFKDKNIRSRRMKQFHKRTIERHAKKRGMNLKPAGPEARKRFSESNKNFGGQLKSEAIKRRLDNYKTKASGRPDLLGGTAENWKTQAKALKVRGRREKVGADLSDKIRLLTAARNTSNNAKVT